MSKSGRNSGNALAIGLFFTTVIAVTTFSLVVVTTSSQKQAGRDEVRAQAMYHAQSALNQALLELNNGIDYDNYGQGVIYKQLSNNSSYYTNYYTDAMGTPTLSATAVIDVGGGNQIQRTIEAKLNKTPGLDLPGYDKQVAAFGINGDYAKGKIKFGKFLLGDEDDDDSDEDDDDDIDENETETLLISGFDASGQGKNVSGINIEDPDIYEKTMESIGKAISKGYIKPEMITGDPLVEYTTKKKKKDTTFKVSSTNFKKPLLSSEYFDKLIDDLATSLTENIIPNASTVITGNNLKIDKDLTLGQDENSITYVIADEIKVEAKISGQGTLVVHGDIKIEPTGSLDWKGNIVVLPELKPKDVQKKDLVFNGTFTHITKAKKGDSYTVTHNVSSSELGKIPANSSKDTRIKNHGGNIGVDGNFIMLATSGGKEVALDIKPKNIDGSEKAGDDDVDDDDEYDKERVYPTTTVNGSLLLLSNSEKKGKARFRHQGGLVNINGIMSVVGRKAVLNISPRKKAQANSEFKVYGNVTIALPTIDANKKDKLKVKIKGNTNLIYHSLNVENAIKEMLKFSKMLGDDSPLSTEYTILSWRETTTPAGDPSKGYFTPNGGYPQ